MYVDPDGQFFFVALLAAMGIGSGATGAAAFAVTVAAALDTASWAGAGAMAGDAIWQTGGHWINDIAKEGKLFDFGDFQYNGQQGLNTFASAAGSSLFGSMFGGIDFGKGFINETLSAGMNQGITSMALGSIGQDLSQIRYGDLFSQGFVNGALAHTAKSIYKAGTGWNDIDARPGNGVAGPNEKLTGLVPGAVKGFNNIGAPIGDKSIWAALWTEGGPISSALNLIPGFNASAGLHDYWAGIPLHRGINTIPSMFAAMTATYASFLSPY